MSLAVSTARRGPPSGAPAFLAREIHKVAYVDGFNLYYGCLKNSRWRWLDLVSLFEMVLQSHHQIATAKCFMARLLGTPGNPSMPQRQETYLRALQHFRPEVDIYFGHFLRHRVGMPLADPKTCSSRMV